MRSCEKFELLASLAIDREVTETEQAELAAHLETCPDCRAYYEDLQRIHGVFVREEITVPEGLAVRVMDRVRETPQDRLREERKKTVPFPRWQRWAALAACCAVAALSVWAFRGTGGVKDAMVAMDDTPQSVQDMRSTAGTPATGEPDVSGIYPDTEDADDAAPSGDLPEIPEEYKDLAKSAAKDGEAEGQYQPLLNDAPELVRDAEPAPAMASVPTESTEDDAELDALPADDNFDRANAPAMEAGESEDNPSEEGSGVPEDTPEAPELSEETEKSGSLEETPEEKAETEEPVVEPVEILGVPEPGILIAYGSAAQVWVETVLSQEWASGGSYPLTAEQYADLLQTLDEAGELYRIEPGEGYCLMTE